MFKDKFEKFKKSTADLNIIPDETKKIIIGMSGGKDCAVMAHFLLEYKKQVRPDIELELWTASMPNWEQKPETLLINPIDPLHKEILLNQKKSIEVFQAYWTNLIKCKSIPVEEKLYEDRILKMNWGCMLCFSTKMKGFNKYLKEQPYGDNTLIAFGWTKWDAHYTLFSHLLKSNGSKWHELKKNNYQKYKADCTALASFAAYPKVNLGIPNKKIYRINPLLEFDDNETSELAQELEVPIIKDICNELYGTLFEQDRRFLSKYIQIYSNNQSLLKLPSDSLLFSYKNLFNFFRNIEMLPPVEDLDNVIYDAYNSNFDEFYNLLKKTD